MEKSDEGSEETLDMLPRLPQCDDSELEGLFSKLPPPAISLLSTESDGVCNKVVDDRGTTIGVISFDEGLIAFMDSRRATTFEDKDPEVKNRDLKKSYLDGVLKFEVISSQFNLYFLRAGTRQANKLFAQRLTFEVQRFTSDENEEEELSMSIEQAVLLGQKVLGEIAEAGYYKTKIFGGVLFGLGPNQEYQAYRLQSIKSTVKDPLPLRDKDFFYLFRSGAPFAKSAIYNHLELNFEPSLERRLEDIKIIMLHTHLNTCGSGGPTKVFLLRNGQEVKEEPDYVFDPVMLHLESEDFEFEHVILLIVADEDAGKYDDVEKQIGDWKGVECVSRLTKCKKGPKGYSVYRAFCLDDNSTKEVLNRLEEGRMEEATGDIPNIFTPWLVDLGTRKVQMYGGICDREKLLFIQGLL